MNTTQLNEPQQEDSKPLVSIGGLVNALRRQWLPATAIFALIFGGVAFWTYRQKPTYEATGSLIFKIDRAAQLANVNNSASGQPTDVPAANPISLENELLAVRSASVVDDAIKKSGLSMKRDEVISILKVEIGKGTDILTLSYKSRDAKEAAAIVNQLMNSYTENSLKVSKQETVKAKDFIQTQLLPKVSESLMKSELDLRKFREKNAIAALAQESSASITAATGLKQRIVDIKIQLASLEASSRDLKGRLGITTDQAIVLSRLSGSEGVRQTLTELNRVEAQLAVQRTQYQEDHPSVKRLQRQKASLQILLQQRVDAVGGGKSISPSDLSVSTFELGLITDLLKAESNKASLEQQLTSLNEALNSYNTYLREIPKLEQEQQFLERKILLDRSTYESLQRRLQELQLAENQTVNRARVLSEADVPTQPVSPKVINNLLLGGVLGLAAAIAIAVGLQSRDKLLRTTDEVRRLFGYNLLGVLPNFGKKWAGKQAVFVRANPRSPISESYRMLQTNLRFRKSDSPVKVIVVTSSIASEGKSTVAANLAATAAQLGKRALLVDADMRRPSQQLIWNVPNTQGLSDLVLSKATEESAIQKAVMPNLNLLLSGTIPSNPLSLLDSSRMASLVKAWSDDYDFVIIDTPPLLAVADAMVLGNLANGILLVARPDLLNSTDATRVRATLTQSGMSVLGMVINAAVLDDKSYYEHQYDYASKEEPSSTPMVG